MIWLLAVGDIHTKVDCAGNRVNVTPMVRSETSIGNDWSEQIMDHLVIDIALLIHILRLCPYLW
jgi:hypothetical protein